MVRIDNREKMRKKAGSLYKRKGSSVRSVAAELGLSYGATHRLIAESEVGLRSRGRPQE